MQNTQFRLGVQSYCFRTYKTMPELMSAVKQTELGYVEIWPGHLDYHSEWEAVDAGLGLLKEAGLEMEAYGAVSITADEKDMRRLMDFARRAGLRYLTVVRLDEAALPMAEELSREYGVLFAEHNHGRRFRYGTFRELEELFGKTSSAMGLCLDAAWFLDSGEDPLAAVDVFRDRLYGVHLKDFAFDEKGDHRDVIVGQGGLDLPRFVEKLEEIRFDGYMSLEYEGDEEDPIPSTLECLKEVRKVLPAG